jgi:hypothetical protein
MKNFATIEITQNTGTGHEADAETKLYISDSGIGNSIVISDRADYLNILGTVTIKHPSIMAGSWSEMLAFFETTASNYLLALGLVKENDYGTMFPTEAMYA